MDGQTMKRQNLSLGRLKVPQWDEGITPGTSVMRNMDKALLAIWLLALVGCFAFYIYSSYVVPDDDDLSKFSAMQYMALPFAVVGFAFMACRRNILPIIALVVLGAAMVIAKVPFIYIYITLFILVGAAGVACVVCALQRLVFYRVMRRVRYLNVKQKLGAWDRLAAFVFNVPPDVDTRNIEVTVSQFTKAFPWRDMLQTVWLGMGVGMIFWIYITLNPTFAMVVDAGEASMFVFTVMLYVPVIILPFSIFRSMDARITTNFREFHLYNGAIATLSRMAIPVFAAFVYALIAMESDFEDAVKYIALSGVLILVIVASVSIIYYYTMEADAVRDIGKKWGIFMPVPLLVSLRAETDEEPWDFPATPERDEADMGSVSLPAPKK